jgi:DNA-binding transcriptional LysR family regulator
LPSLPSIDTQALRAFVAVAREGNVSRAALQLHLSQPAVSLQLKGLSQSTGLTLFSRTSHGLSLTADGSALLPQAERALLALEDFARGAQSLQSTLRGRLRIGTILDPEFTRLGAFLKALVEGAPQIETVLRQAMSGDVGSEVARNALDVGFFLTEPGVVPDSPLEMLTLTRFTYRVLAPAGWGPLVLGRDWAGLAALPWLATPPASVHSRLQARVFGPGSLSAMEPRRVALVDQEASMLDLVRSGVGLSLVRDSIAIREAQARGLVVADQVRLDCELAFVFQASRRHDPLVARALRALASVWR